MSEDTAAVERAARALNVEGWTCYGGAHEPEHYDDCDECHRVCNQAARAALDAVGASAAPSAKTVPCCPPGVVRIEGHWLVETHTHCTCGGSGILSPAHQPGCGTVPLIDLRGLDGWDGLRDELAPSGATVTVEQLDALLHALHRHGVPVGGMHAAARDVFDALGVVMTP